MIKAGESRNAENNRRWRAAHPDKAKASCLKWKRKNADKCRLHTKKGMEIYRGRFPEKAEAHRLVYRALKKGDLIRPGHCSTCTTPRGRIEGHHADYSKPLDVIWVCRSCHVKIHHGEKSHD